MTSTETGNTVHRPVRVVLVNDEEIILEGLRAMLARHVDRVELVGGVPLTDDLVANAASLRADLALLDMNLHGTSGLDVAASIMAEQPPFRVVIFTDEADERRLFEALRLGVSGYLLKSLNSAQLADHLLRIHDGEVEVDPAMATRIAMRAAHLGGGRVWPGSQLGLSQRESDVLTLLVEGLSNRMIASQLVVGEETVKTHLRSIYRKLGVNDRAQAIAAAIRQGMFS